MEFFATLKTNFSSQISLEIHLYVVAKAKRDRHCTQTDVQQRNENVMNLQLLRLIEVSNTKAEKDFKLKKNARENLEIS